MYRLLYHLRNGAPGIDADAWPGRAAILPFMRLETAAFQGERGAFSEEAARRLLGSRVRVLPCQRFEELFRNLTEKRVQAAVVPIENTLAGSVHEDYDHLLHHDLPIVAETNVRIVHNLIAPPGVPFRKIRCGF